MKQLHYYALSLLLCTRPAIYTGGPAQLAPLLPPLFTEGRWTPGSRPWPRWPRAGHPPRPRRPTRRRTAPRNPSPHSRSPHTRRLLSARLAERLHGRVVNMPMATGHRPPHRRVQEVHRGRVRRLRPRDQAGEPAAPPSPCSAPPRPPSIRGGHHHFGATPSSSSLL